MRPGGWWRSSPRRSTWARDSANSSRCSGATSCGTRGASSCARSSGAHGRTGWPSRAAHAAPATVARRLQAAYPTASRGRGHHYVFGTAIGGRVARVRKAWMTCVLRAHHLAARLGGHDNCRRYHARGVRHDRPALPRPAARGRAALVGEGLHAADDRAVARPLEHGLAEGLSRHRAGGRAGRDRTPQRRDWAVAGAAAGPRGS